MYEPRGTPPTDLEALALYLQEELSLLSQALTAVDAIQLPVSHAEPEKPRDGLIVLADGTDWNPGSGAGFYGRSAGAWVFLG